MTTRLNPFKNGLDDVRPLIDFGLYAGAGIDPTIAELVKIRASQINGCAACLLMHTREARRNGETEERLNLLAAWREVPDFTPRERAALEWTEALTRLGPDGVPDAAYAALDGQFSAEEQLKITLLVGAINAFNRLNVGFRVHVPDASERKAA